MNISMNIIVCGIYVFFFTIISFPLNNMRTLIKVDRTFGLIRNPLAK